MFKKLKNMIFGAEKAVEEVAEPAAHKVEEVVEEVVEAVQDKTTAVRKKAIKVKETVKPVVVKAPVQKTTTSKGKHTKASLNVLTKAELLSLAKIEFKLELNARDKKDKLIKEIITAQSK